MVSNRPSPPVLAGVVSAGVGVVLQAVGLGTPHWITFDADSSTGAGLWETCFKGTCLSYSDVLDWMVACRAFGVVGALLLAACFLFAFLPFIPKSKAVFRLAATLAFAAGLCIVVELAIYADKSHDAMKAGPIHYGFSFFVTIVAIPVAVGAGVSFIVASVRLAVSPAALRF